MSHLHEADESCRVAGRIQTVVWPRVTIQFKPPARAAVDRTSLPAACHLFDILQCPTSFTRILNACRDLIVRDARDYLWL
jgi:hypothetical protein